MSTPPRRPKKVLIQFAIALVVAVALGVGALAISLKIIGGVSNHAHQVEQDAQKEKKKLLFEQRRLKRQQEELAQVPKSYPIVEAAIDLSPGESLSPDMLNVTSQNTFPPAGSITMLSDAVGKIVKTAIFKGEPLRLEKLQDLGAGIIVPPGYRATAIQVDSIGGVNGAISPGQSVDVLITITRQDNSITKTLLQNIQVLAIGDHGDSGSGAAGMNAASNTVSKASQSLSHVSSPIPTSSNSKGGSSSFPVTLKVTPRQAERLTLANAIGVFHLSLRNPNDDGVEAMSGADLTTLMTASSGVGTRLNGGKPVVSKSMLQKGSKAQDALPAPSAIGTTTRPAHMEVMKGSGVETVDFK